MQIKGLIDTYRTQRLPQEGQGKPAPVPALATMPGDRLEIRRSLVHPGTPTQPTMDMAVAKLEAIEQDLVRKGDARAVFVTTYLMQTKATAAALAEPGRFEDPAFMNRLALRFVQYFLDAYGNYEAGQRDKVPAPWLRAFDLATQKKTLVMEDLVLGINAHINYDLPRALVVVGANTPAHERDFSNYNQLLYENIQPVKDAIVDRYTKEAFSVNLLGLADKLSLKLDDRVAEETFSLLRNRAWEYSRRIAAGDSKALSDSLDDAMTIVKAIELQTKAPFHDDLARARVL